MHICNDKSKHKFAKSEISAKRSILARGGPRVSQCIFGLARQNVRVFDADCVSVCGSVAGHYFRVGFSEWPAKRSVCKQLWFANVPRKQAYRHGGPKRQWCVRKARLLLLLVAQTKSADDNARYRDILVVDNLGHEWFRIKESG